MSSLPGELIDAILDWSSTHPPSSLAAYALVSRQWLPRSRHHHFASISLTRDRSTDNVKPFLHLVASPLVTFLSSIRDVQLYHRSSYGIPVLSAGDITLLLSKFGIHPTRLTLDCHFTQLGMQGSHQNSFTSLTHLHLSLYGEVPLEKLFSYLSAFPSLKSLSLGIRQSGSELGWISMQLQHNFTELPPSLHELDVHQPNILRCLSSVDASAQFSTLILRGIRRFHDVTQYLRNSAISTALISLTLDNCVTDAHFDLSRLNSLRHLHIRQHQIWTASAVLEALAAIAINHVHGSFSPRPLEMVELTIYGVEFLDPEDMDMAPWRELDAALAGTDSHLTWPHLRRLAVGAHDWTIGVPENVSRAVRQNMPLCDGRGFLVFP